MAFKFLEFAFPCTLKSTVTGLALVLVSGGLGPSQFQDEFALCSSSVTMVGSASAVAAPAVTPAPTKHDSMMSSDMHAPTVLTLRSGVAEGRLVYIGVGGDINGIINPLLIVHEGETVQINLINGEGAEHDIVVDQYGARSGRVVGKGASSAVTFTASKTGEFAYYCSAPGHREAGMEGRIRLHRGPERLQW